MGLLADAVFNLRAVSMAFVAQSESLRSGEVMKTQKQQRAELGRGLDTFILEVIFLILEFALLIFTG